MMQEDDTEGLFYLGAGPLTAILLGAALVPLRGFTSASNFTFVFLALTIAVAEFGGRWAAVATALCSALSLDFFLTQPYMKLAIDDKHDIIAFVGLVVCGLIAAAFGAQRSHRIAVLTRVRKHRDLLHAALAQWGGTASLEPQLAKVLGSARDVLPLAGAAVRDDRGAFVAGCTPADGLRPEPQEILEIDTLLPAAAAPKELRRQDLVLPDKGGRIALVSGDRRVGWLDIWGNGSVAGAESRRAISDLARLVAIFCVSESRGAVRPE